MNVWAGYWWKAGGWMMLAVERNTPVYALYCIRSTCFQKELRTQCDRYSSRATCPRLLSCQVISQDSITKDSVTEHRGKSSMLYFLISFSSMSCCGSRLKHYYICAQIWNNLKRSTFGSGAGLTLTASHSTDELWLCHFKVRIKEIINVIMWAVFPIYSLTCTHTHHSQCKTKCKERDQTNTSLMFSEPVVCKSLCSWERTFSDFILFQRTNWNLIVSVTLNAFFPTLYNLLITRYCSQCQGVAVMSCLSGSRVWCTDRRLQVSVLYCRGLEIITDSRKFTPIKPTEFGLIINSTCVPKVSTPPWWDGCESSVSLFALFLDLILWVWSQCQCLV